MIKKEENTWHWANQQKVCKKKKESVCKMKTQYNTMQHNSDDEDQYESQEEGDYHDEDVSEEYDYDQLDFADVRSEQPTANMHSSLVQDIENIKKKYGEKAIDCKKTEYLEDIHIELHLPGSSFDYEVAKVWKIKQDEDIIVRLNMNFKKYFGCNNSAPN